MICRNYLQKLFVEIINTNNLQIIDKRKDLKILKDPVIASIDQFDLVFLYDSKVCVFEVKENRQTMSM